MVTRKSKSRAASAAGTWKLQDAKARFSEVVRRARVDGPQRVTVHGKDAVVIVAAEDHATGQPAGAGVRTGAELVAAMQQARRLGLKLKPLRTRPRMRPPVTFTDSE
jgi:prevent-host-death family protein